MGGGTNMRSALCAALLLAMVGLAGHGLASEKGGTLKVDESIPEYKPTDAGLAGKPSSVGSNTLKNMMLGWKDAFQKLYPGVDMTIQDKGSGTAPPALIDGTAQFGPMSRAMKPEEVDKFEKAKGYKPTQIRVAVDTLAVFVNKDNPVKSLTLAQLDSIFSAKALRGGGVLKTWGQVGVTGELAGQSFSAYGRDSASGTHEYFKDHVLKKGDFSTAVKEQAGSSAVVQNVAKEANAIGYSGIGFGTSDVRAVPLVEKDGSDAFAPTQENAYTGKYPLTRFLYIYVNKEPGKPLDPLVKEFLKLVLSQQGQTIVIQDGNYPLPARVAQEELKKLE